MKKLLLLAVVAVVGAAGCQSIAGPFKNKQKDRERPADPLLNPDLDEQQKYGRSRYSYVEDNRDIGPKGYSDRPSPSGR